MKIAKWQGVALALSVVSLSVLLAFAFAGLFGPEEGIVPSHSSSDAGLPESEEGIVPSSLSDSSGHTVYIENISRAEYIKISDAEIGDGGIGISGNVSGTPGTELYIEELVIKNVMAPYLSITGNVSIHKLKIDKAVADGYDIYKNSTDAPNVKVGLYGASEGYEISGDVSAVEVKNNITGRIRLLKIENVYSQGDIRIGNVTVGTLTIKNVEIGRGDGFGSADLVIGSSSNLAKIQSSEGSVSVKSVKVM